MKDKDAALMARRLAKDEGILVGYSSGANIQALYQYKDHFDEDSLVVTFICDHGSRYLGKVFCDKWMTEQGFIE